MEDEYKFQLVIVPESYDYVDEEIVYRIYFDRQLISERSLPLLKDKQAITDNFLIIMQKKYIFKTFIFENIKNKKANIKNIKINNIIYNPNLTSIRSQGIHISVKIL